MSNSIFLNLSSLGCNFAVQDRETIADPEKTILEAIEFFWKDKKIFTLLIALLKYRISHIVNTKRLFNLSQQLSYEKKALLRVIAIKVYRQTGDLRYRELEKKLNKRANKIIICPKKYQDPFFINKKGLDKDFLKVGIKVADFFEGQPEKKLKPLKRIYSENEWLRLRAISGPDYRADTLYLKKYGLANTQSEITEWLQCNKSSISRIWTSLKNIEDLIEYI